jgi:hypothetical protein
MRWWLIAGVYQPQYYSQGSERLLLMFQLVRHADAEHDRCAFQRIQGAIFAHSIIEYLGYRAKHFLAVATEKPASR